MYQKILRNRDLALLLTSSFSTASLLLVHAYGEKRAGASQSTFDTLAEELAENEHFHELVGDSFEIVNPS